MFLSLEIQEPYQQFVSLMQDLFVLASRTRQNNRFTADGRKKFLPSILFIRLTANLRGTTQELSRIQRGHTICSKALCQGNPDKIN